MLFTMDIDKVLNNKRLVSGILGVTKEEFLSLLPTFEQIVREDAESKKRKRAFGGGCNGKIKEARKKLFFILVYIKIYPTFDTAAFIFASSKSRTHTWAHKILPLLEKTLGRKVVLPKRQIRTPEEFLSLFPGIKEVLIDGVERPMQRPKKNKNQKKTYSGKKKRHTRKNLVITDPKKTILVLTPSKNGKVHDKKLSDKALVTVNLPQEVSLLADTGFVGITKQHENTLMPKKKPRGGELTEDDRAMNKLISSVRIKVEHALSGVKRFRCVSEVFRNKNGWDDKLALVCAGLWNFHVKMT